MNGDVGDKVSVLVGYTFWAAWRAGTVRAEFELVVVYPSFLLPQHV